MSGAQPTAAPTAPAVQVEQAVHIEQVGVGPHPQPWPTGNQWDPELLAHGDARNVLDHYRYMTVDAIRADLDAQRNPQAHLHIAIENWHHDFNIGSVVRTANAFNVAGVHIVGKRKWNRRGAMVTERYLHVQHHETPQHLQEWAGTLPIVGIDNVPGSLPIESATLPATGILVFGQESTGLTPAMQEACQQILHITQYGSTRSMNAGAAAAIAMYQWSTSHRKCVAS